MIGNVLVIPMPIVAFATILLADGCVGRSESPVVRACMSVLPSSSGSDGPSRLTSCRCADNLAVRQLDPAAYRLLTQLAAATISDGTVVERGEAATSAVAQFRRQTGPVDAAIAAADLAMIGVKASRCV
jgi:hypothetical protein